MPRDTLGFEARRAPFNYVVHSKWSDPSDDEANVAWMRGLRRRAAPFATGGVYLNFTGEEQQDRVLAAYGVEAYARLRALKDRYDPSNVLRLNHNVSPSGRLARAGTTIRGGNDGRHREVTG